MNKLIGFFALVAARTALVGFLATTWFLAAARARFMPPRAS